MSSRSGSEPLVSRQTVREHARPADMLWEAAVRGFDPFPQRLRTLADAAEGQARVIRLAELANLPWRPTENAREISLASGLEADGGRQGPPTLWADFDRRVRALGEAMETDQNSRVYTAFEALRDSARQIADALDPPVDVEGDSSIGDPAQAQAG